MRRGLPILLGATVLTSCGGRQSALDPAGPHAQALADLIWLFTWVCIAIWALTMLALAIALARRRPSSTGEPHAPAPDEERPYLRVVSTAVGLTTVIILALTALSYVSHRGIADAPQGGITIRVIAHQWWWEVRYEDAVAGHSFTTANEIHIPVGELTRVSLVSTDVIHSFWVPNLMGKQDAITGHDSQVDLIADKAGTYRGQCAEFCGLQHAQMALQVIAEPRDAFAAWRQSQLAPAAEPSDPERQKGKAVFESQPCSTCHTIRGTSAAAKVAPDLTHVAGRSYIAAGALPMSSGSLAAWIADPQTIKPGVHMPLTMVEPDELNALVAYLDGLK